MSATVTPTPAAWSPPAHGWRTFLALWATQSCSMIGTMVTFFTFNIWITQALYPEPAQKHALALALSASGSAYALPTVFGALLGGVWADRHDRRRVMLIANLVNAGVAGTLVLLLARGALTLPLLVALTLVYALVGAVHASAFDTSYAVLVPADRLTRANGMMQSVWALSALAAPGVAAVLVGVGTRHGHTPLAVSHGAALAVSIDAASFVIASLVLTRLSLPTPPRAARPPGERPSFRRELGEGARFVLSHRPLLVLLGTFALANLVFAMLSVLQPLIVKFRLADDTRAHGQSFESALAWLASLGAAGGVAGAVLMSAWGGLKRRRVYGVIAPMAIAGAMLAALGFTRRLATAAGVMFLCEGTVPLANAHSYAIWQTRTPHALQGRVFAVRRTIAQFTYPLGTLLAGPLAAAFDPASVLIGAGALFFVAAGLQLFNPALRQIEDG